MDSIYFHQYLGSPKNTRQSKTFFLVLVYGQSKVSAGTTLVEATVKFVLYELGEFPVYESPALFDTGMRGVGDL